MKEDLESWRSLLAELDRWSAADKTATLWWRDDDATAPTPALDRMLALSTHHRIPLGLAVIPASAKTALVRRLADEPLVEVLQHGYIHKNHACPGERAAEFGQQRPLEVRAGELARGWQGLAEFRRRTPIFVPPWNRYDAEIAPTLGALGVTAVSAFGATKQLPLPVHECNCHVDIISWRTTRGFAGTSKTVTKLIDHLSNRRTGAISFAQVTGVLSHHLAHDEGCWTFLAELFERLGGHPAARWMRPSEAMVEVAPA